MLRKRVIITGGMGFIGSAMVRHLIQNTECYVLNIDSLTYSANPLNVESVSSSDRYNFKKIDICDTQNLNNVIEQFKPDSVFHFAAESHVDNSIKDPSKFINTNIYGTYNLLRAFTNYINNPREISNDNFRFIHVSTDEVFGSLGLDDNPFNEKSRYAPNSPYSSSKASSDHIVRAWNKTYDFPSIITNCSNNYGKHQNIEKLIPKVITNAVYGKNIPIYGKGKQIRDWLHVDDHIKALCKILTEGIVGSSYCIGGNNELKNIDLIKLILQKLSNLPSSYFLSNNIQKKTFDDYFEQIEFVKDRLGHDFRYSISSNKLYNEMGWKPSTPFCDGLEQTIKWYLLNLKDESS